MLRYRLYCLFSLTCLGCFYKGQAQTVQQVIGAAGGTSRSVGAYTIDFTVGETVIVTAGTDPSCTEGFQQPLSNKDLGIVTAPPLNPGNQRWFVQVYPNPLHEQLTIHGYADQDDNLDFRLIDMTGRILWIRRLSFVQGFNDALLSVGTLSRGIYVLSINEQAHGGHKEVKLLKE
jgi:hypothetical protein